MKPQFVLTTCALLLAATFRLWHIAAVPPGLYRDEAFDLLQAQAIDRGQDFPIYITGDHGNEPLIAYSAALTLLLLGPVSWAGRLATAWVGLIGVAATIRVGQEMFPRQAAGWLAGAALGTLFWNVDLSRYGVQVIMAATAAAATMAALWRGARTGSRWAFFMAGVCLGLGLDAYVAFRLFPIVPLLSGLALLLAGRGNRRSWIVGGGIALLATLLVYAPLGLFFIRHPEWFFNRFNETTAATLDSAHLGSNLLSNAVKTLGGLFYKGDENWRQNLAGRPALDAAQMFFGLMGCAALAWRRCRLQAASLVVWLLVGLAPSVVTTEAPHFARTTMVTPAIALLMGLGLSTAWNWSRRNRTLQGAIVVLSLLSVASTAHDYFGTWAHSADLFSAFDLEQVEIGRVLKAAPPGTALYGSYLPTDRWTVEYLLGAEAYRATTLFNSADCLILPTPATEPAAYVVGNPGGPQLLPLLRRAFPAATYTDMSTLVAPPGQAAIGLFLIPGGQQPLAPVAVTRSADFGGFARMLGYSLTPAGLQPGGTIKLHVVWQIEQQTPTAYKTFVHLLGRPKADGSTVYTQRDSQPCADSYATTGWTAGDLLVADTTLDLPADLPPDTYTLQTGWYDSVTGARAPVSGDAGPHKDDAAQLLQLVASKR